MPPIRILLADDHAVVRDGLRALLDRQPDLVIVAEASDGRECLELFEEHAPDVVMMDVAMPKMNGIEAARRILAANPATAGGDPEHASGRKLRPAVSESRCERISA